MPIAPHQFWQGIDAPGTHSPGGDGRFRELYPAELPDRRQLALPIRVLPGEGTRAVASLIVNQASFAVEDVLIAAMTELAAPFEAEVVVGVPTLGLSLGAGVARRLGHSRSVALGTSRKFWYRNELSVPLSSITSPAHAKRLFLDPRMLPLLENRRVVVVDDVVSSGASMAAVLQLLRLAGIAPVGLVAAMLQTERWRETLAEVDPRIPATVRGAFRTPLLRGTPEAGWSPE